MGIDDAAIRLKVRFLQRNPNKLNFYKQLCFNHAVQDPTSMDVLVVPMSSLDSCAICVEEDREFFEKEGIDDDR